jgi:hypothetical protein
MFPAVEAAVEADDTEDAGVPAAPGPVVSEELTRRLVEQARTEGLSLIGPGGLLGDVTKRVLETSLEVEISAHFAEVYGASVSKDTVTRITDTVLAEMADWQNRPLDRVYPVLFVDVISSRSATATSPTGPSTWWLASPSTEHATSSAGGSAKAAKAPNIGPGC